MSCTGHRLYSRKAVLLRDERKDHIKSDNRDHDRHHRVECGRVSCQMIVSMTDISESLLECDRATIWVIDQSRGVMWTCVKSEEGGKVAKENHVRIYRASFLTVFVIYFLTRAQKDSCCARRVKTWCCA